MLTQFSVRSARSLRSGPKIYTYIGLHALFPRKLALAISGGHKIRE